MTDYRPTIGLEIHAELKTSTKMFCDSKNDPDEKRPNVNICPICMGHPGTLPVINKAAVKHVLKVGVALGAEIANLTEFDRKNYFYPDLPKGYQISQYKYPLVKGGELEGVLITRVHLEEDTARSIHPSGGGNYSLLDFNRAGVPLMELVTEPVVESAEQAGRFAREFQLLLRYLGASDANMEKGEMRVEANVSISKTDSPGTKVEVKNLNSFRSVDRAIAYEVKRQKRLLEKGETVQQETRGWDEAKQKTVSQRIKEESHDYRYFPEPDLPKLEIRKISEFSKENIQKEIHGKLPDDQRKRYKKIGLPNDIIEILVREHFPHDPSRRRGFDFKAAIEGLRESDQDYKGIVKEVANYIVVEMPALNMAQAKQNNVAAGSIRLEKLKKLPLLARKKLKGEISSRMVKDALAAMMFKGTDIKKFLEGKGDQISEEGELADIVEEIIKENPKVVADYKSGKEKALQFLVGQGMKETKGGANPQVLRDMFVSHMR